MLVITTESDYSNILDIQDVPPAFLKSLSEGGNPLFIGARTGQTKRVRDLLDNYRQDNETPLPVGFACSVWNLGHHGFLTNNGNLELDKWKKYSVVFAADPSRVAEPYRKAYERLLWTLKSL